MIKIFYKCNNILRCANTQYLNKFDHNKSQTNANETNYISKCRVTIAVLWEKQNEKIIGLLILSIPFTLSKCRHKKFKILSVSSFEDEKLSN